MRNFLLSARQFFSFNFDLIAVIVMLFWVSYSGSMTHWNSTSGSDLDHFLNLHFILHQPAKFRPIRRRHCGNVDLYFTINMTSYHFIKMAAADAEYYFRFRICWYRCLRKVKVYEQTKFRRHIPIVERVVADRFTEHVESQDLLLNSTQRLFANIRKYRHNNRTPNGRLPERPKPI